MTRIGPTFAYERLSWVNPYIGAQLYLYGYRHSAALSGAELQGGGAGYEPVFGMHFPVLFDRRVSAYGEYRLTRPFDPSKGVIQASASLSAGMGMTF
jgi:hypothetical protein